MSRLLSAHTSCVAAALVALAILAATATAISLPGYTASTLVANGRASFHWRVDGVPGSTTERGYFALQAPTTTGWLGFGVGEISSGSMPGADMAVATIAADGTVTIGDYHALDFTTPRPDCNPTTSDWTLVASQRNATHTAIEFSRRLQVTSSDEDRAIARRPNDSPSKFLVAWGPTSATGAIGYHGRSDRALFAVDIFGGAPVDRLAALRADPSVEVLEWRSRNLRVPPTNTLYAYTPCTRPPLGNTGRRQIVAFNVVVSPPESKPFLHHMVVKGYTNARCEGIAVDLYAVASSHVPFIFPADIGLGMDFQSYDVEIHYDNPRLVENLTDSSGVEVFATRVDTPLRTNNAGVLVAADPIVQTPYLVEPGYTAIDYDCPSSCTSRWEDNITVFGELLHMHQTGNMMRTNFVAPDGETVIATSEAEWYSFHTQENQLLDRRFVVPRGSAINTRCVFTLPQGRNTVRFGIGSDQEMCMHFIYYYPALQARTAQMCGVNFCGNIRSKTVQQEPHMRHQFNGSCGVIGAPTPTPAPLVSVPSLAERLASEGPVSAASSLQGVTVSAVMSVGAAVAGLVAML